jgi:tRNA threonylcarbamoyladenosine biosynthesis protein TsaE
LSSLITRQASETLTVGAKLGALLEPGDFIALCGELGSGKTHFAKGVAAGLGVAAESPVTSPTYTLMNIYAGRLPFYHFDLYRLAGNTEIQELGFEDYFHGNGVCLVEWAECMIDELPAERLTITFSSVGEKERRLEFVPAGPRYVALVQRLFQAAQ